MNTGFKSHVVPQYRLLTQEQIEEIHLGTLEILQTIGVQVDHEGALEMLRSAGCRVRDRNIVLIPNWLVEECIRSAPSRITIYNRNGQEAMRLQGRNIHFGLGTDLINSYDLQTGELRPSLLKDVVNAARVADYCDQIDFIASFALPHDVPTNTMYLECMRAMLQNSTKPIFFTAAGEEDLAVIFEMASAVAGGEERLREKPFLIHYSEPTPPLRHSYGAVRKLFLCADKEMPVTYVPGCVLGGSCPVTLAGGVTQANAEALSGIVLHQLRRKGAPIISGWAVVPIDMLKATYNYGAPERRLTNSVFADLYHYYGIPMWSTVGSDTHVFDQQAGLEHALCTLLAALDGANLIHDVGYMGQGLIGNPAMLVMCNEIISYVKRLTRGFELSTETMAIDVIRQVGPGGHFLSEHHTLKHFRTELWNAQLLNRYDIDEWKQKGRPTYGDRVLQKTLDILATHGPEPLPEAVSRQLAVIASRAEQALADKHFKA